MEGYFRKLIVWQKGMDLVQMVYRVSKTFPADERYALTDQLRRAVVSIPSNIAEGNGRAGNKDYAHFLSIARGSLFETMTQIEIAQRLGYLKEDEEFTRIISLTQEIASMLTAMLIKQGSIPTTVSPLPSKTNPTTVSSLPSNLSPQKPPHHSSTSTLNFNFSPAPTLSPLPSNLSPQSFPSPL